MPKRQIIMVLGGVHISGFLTPSDLTSTNFLTLKTPEIHYF